MADQGFFPVQFFPLEFWPLEFWPVQGTDPSPLVSVSRWIDNTNVVRLFDKRDHAEKP